MSEFHAWKFPVTIDIPFFHDFIADLIHFFVGEFVASEKFKSRAEIFPSDMIVPVEIYKQI